VRGLVLAIALMLVCEACGSRRSYDELLAGEAAPVPTTGLAASPDPGAGSTGGEVGTAIEPGAPTTTTAPVGGAVPTSIAAGSGAPGTSPPNAAGGAGAQACTGSKAPIVIGSVGTQTGVVGGAISPGPTGVKAWAAAVNAKGGIRCHPIKYVVADDGGDPARHQALVRQLVEQTKVVAFVHMDAPLTGQASVAYLREKQIPVIGHEGGSPWFYDNPTYFAATSSGDVSLEGVYAVVADAAKQAGKTKIATISCVEAAICSRFNDVVPAFAPKYGGQIVYRAQASLVQPDYTAVCRAAKDALADVLVVFLDGSSVQRTARSCDSVDYHPQLVVPALSMIPALQSDPNLEGVVGAIITAPWTLGAVPAVAEHLRAMAQYAPGAPPGAESIAGWTSAKLFEAALANVPEPITSQGILEGLWAVNGNDLGGLTYPLAFAKGQTMAKRYCVWAVVLHDGKYSSPGLEARKCAAL
jgi:branched-chain amino acid transport system substrate-binding protein